LGQHEPRIFIALVVIGKLHALLAEIFTLLHRGSVNFLRTTTEAARLAASVEHETSTVNAFSQGRPFFTFIVVIKTLIFIAFVAIAVDDVRIDIARYLTLWGGLALLLLARGEGIFRRYKDDSRQFTADQELRKGGYYWQKAAHHNVTYTDRFGVVLCFLTGTTRKFKALVCWFFLPVSHGLVGVPSSTSY
jgi:hypothetical protein